MRSQGTLGSCLGYWNARSFILAIDLMFVIVAFQTNVHRLHRCQRHHRTLYFMQRRMLLPLIPSPRSYLAERAKLLAQNMQIHRERLYPSHPSRAATGPKHANLRDLLHRSDLHHGLADPRGDVVNRVVVLLRMTAPRLSHIIAHRRDPHHHLRHVLDLLADLGLHDALDLLRVLHVRSRMHVQLQIHHHERAHLAGTHVRVALHAGDVREDLVELVDDLHGDAVHQGAHGLVEDLQADPHDHQRHEQSRDGVRVVPAEEESHQGAAQSDHGRHGVGAVVPGIGDDHLAVDLLAHQVGVPVQGFVHQDRHQGGDGGVPLQLALVRRLDLLGAAVAHGDASDQEEQSHQHTANDLHTAMAVGMVQIGGLLREATHDDDDHIRCKITQGVPSIYLSRIWVKTYRQSRQKSFQNNQPDTTSISGLKIAYLCNS